MNCLRSQELLSDHLEGALAPPLERELEEHVARCRDCSELLDALQEVLETLAAMEVPAAPADLTEKILARAPLAGVAGRARRPSGAPTAILGGWPAVASWLAAAAVLALVLFWRPPEVLSDWSRGASRIAHQAYSFGVRTANDAERWLVELNVLRMTVGMAFEDRLDQINERLRAIEEARRRTDEDDAEPSSSRERSREPMALVVPTHSRSST